MRRRLISFVIAVLVVGIVCMLIAARVRQARQQAACLDNLAALVRVLSKQPFDPEVVSGRDAMHALLNWTRG